MKPGSFLWVLTLSISINTAVAEPYILNLYEGLAGRDKNACWADTQFKDAACAKKSFACNFSGRFNGSKMGKVTFPNLSEVRNKVNGLELFFYLPETNRAYSSYEIKDSAEFPFGAELVVFALKQGYGRNNDSSLKILGRVKVGENSVLNLAEPQTQTTVIKFPDVLRAGQSFRLTILGQHFGLRPTSRELKVQISEGKHEIIVSKVFQNSVLEGKTINLDLTKISKNEKIVSIEDKGFSSAYMFEGNMLNTKDNLQLTVQKLNEDRKFIFKIKSLHIPELGKENYEKYFEIFEGTARLTAEGRKKILPLNPPSNVATFNFEGECGKASFKKTASFDIFSEKNEKTKIGTINITNSESSGRTEIYFTDSNGNERDVADKFKEGSCGSEDESRSIRVDYVSKEFTNGWGLIGKGPWGSRAWVRAAASDLQKYGGTFRYGALERVILKFNANGKIEVSGYNMFDRVDSEESNLPGPGKTEFTIENELLWDSDGTFTFDLSC